MEDFGFTRDERVYYKIPGFGVTPLPPVWSVEVVDGTAFTIDPEASNTYHLTMQCFHKKLNKNNILTQPKFDQP